MKKLMVPAAMLAAVVMVVSCDKDNDKPANTTLQKIQAKWNVTSIKLDAGEEDSTYTGVAADYIDFRTDGKVYTNVAGEKDTTAYSVVNDTKLVVDGDTAVIKQLSSSQFVFEAKEAIVEDTLTTTYTLSK
ncbi:hypothetical protein FC093_15970 [Ilyomonas limi]|uniref:Lipocalin-like domain-containing protein n=1 Tax=Ilyomonas limi TaxID=2575867 RepID=A0A4V5UU28_9BACT|nr:hypothetical protein [Ilyomonas limi]TKK66993.1 hypothetical protein FC093_15970 [Ilyomonas limi]